MRFDWDELRRLKERKLLSIQPHESGDYWLLNYTPVAQYSHAWDEAPALLSCRGTVIDKEGVVAARGYRKFFNIGERPDTTIHALSWLGEPEITDKLDGSFVLLWHADLHDRWYFSTRGSFASPQAQSAAHIWREKYGEYADTRIGNYLNYVFELVGPSNRIVCRYPDDDIRLTGVIEPVADRDYGHEMTRTEAEFLGVPCVERFAGNLVKLHEYERPNAEGFVCFWPDHQRRVKVKLAEYVRLHRIVTGLSERTIWEVLATGGDPESVRREIPEEMHAWFDGVAHGLERDRLRHRRAVESHRHALAARGLDAADRTRRKELAAAITGECAEYRAELFRAVDGKEYDSLLWKRIEPKATPLFAMGDE